MKGDERQEARRSNDQPEADHARPQFRGTADAPDTTATPDGGMRPSGIRPMYSEAELKALRQPEAVGEIVDRFMAGVGGGRAAPAAALGARWSEVVGAEYSLKTAPGSCESGRLVVLVGDGATASKLRFKTSQIMQKATEIVGIGVVTSISFRVSPSVAQKPTR